MAHSRWRGFVTDEAGNVLPNATVTVVLESTGATATIYSDRDGAAKANPFTADEDGFVIFYAAGGEYKVTAVPAGGGDPIVLRYEPVGNAQSCDVGTATGNVLRRQDADTLYQPLVQDNLSGSGAPTVNDDSSQGYSVRSLWFDTAASPIEVYILLDASVGFANWQLTSLTVDDLGSAAVANVGTADSELPTNATVKGITNDLETLIHQGI